MTTNNWTRTLKVLASSDAEGWPLADALAAELPGGAMHKDYEPLRNAAAAKGLRVPSVSTLRQYRATGEYWSGRKVTDSVGRTVGFSAHKEAQRAGKVEDAVALLEKAITEVGGNAHKVTVAQVKVALGDTLPTKAATATVTDTTTTTVVPAVVVDTPLEALQKAISRVKIEVSFKALDTGDLSAFAILAKDLSDLTGAEDARRTAKANRPAPVQVQAKPAAGTKHVVKASAPVEVKAEVLADAVEAIDKVAKPEAAKPARKRMRG